MSGHIITYLNTNVGKRMTVIEITAFVLFKKLDKCAGAGETNKVHDLARYLSKAGCQKSQRRLGSR